MRRVILFYFDLRRYAYIEKNNSGEEIFGVLTSMHQVIEKYMNQMHAEKYNIQTDTALYVLYQMDCKGIICSLKKVKAEVDDMMRDQHFPSKLHICAVIGDYYSGYIKTSKSETYNIIGPVMNILEKYIHIIESSNEREIVEGIVLSTEMNNHINTSDILKKVNISNEELLIV